MGLCGLQFFLRYVLDRKMERVKIIQPPRSRTLPDIPTREEVQLLINTVRRLRYRVFFLAVYSMGLRISEGVDLEIGDIDGKQLRVHIRDGKGGKDRYMPLPVVMLLNLRRLLENPSTSTAVVSEPIGQQVYGPACQ